MDDGRRVYEVRYGWNAQAVKGALLCLLFLGLAFVPGSPGWAAAVLGVMGAILFSGIALLACSRRVALRVGPEGVMLGGTPFGIRAELTEWPEVASIELWTEPPHRMVKTSYIGVRHKNGSAPLPGSSPALRQIDEYLAEHVPAGFVEAFSGTVLSSRGMVLWRVDRARLKATLRAFAPEVYLFDHLD
ncbi:hypothetical protein [Streptomyces acidiscabies]|uniref:Uncharacterized protein n=1 Tax=Streptomyces acidiscabies TaxID=42234 RepID=A0AAP6BMN3_9ACTN|nr:hypothetical protein [Streptomyces acidiscabies]MBP5942366.1 hypothetical protein [Streptomyces sp. LBUM 1476]MBZ3913940.1 hypothetical protein [Streptomyces acidiscabies]MDX2967455.1 hypothetical protein [Streptomyces acidiscabies]MDX3026211.1 hypothetical protein [Streptomyces acidiscabies]MDX3797138.1 hypothetical protein [Streptomyces acidiscabies]